MKTPMIFKGIEISFTIKPHGETEVRTSVDFDLNDTHYHNAFVSPKIASEQEFDAGHKRLVKWAKTVIKENIK